MNDLIDTFLHRVPVLAGLNDDAIACLTGLGHEEAFAPEAVLIGEGELGNKVYFLRTGHVTVVKGYGGPSPVELARFSPGECFGEMSMVESAARSATVVAEDEVTVFTLRGADLHRLYHALPAQYGILILNVARQLARRVRALDEQLWQASR